MEKLFTNLDLLNTIKSQTNLEKIPLEYLRNDLFEQKKKYEFDIEEKVAILNELTSLYV